MDNVISMPRRVVKCPAKQRSEFAKQLAYEIERELASFTFKTSFRFTGLQINLNQLLYCLTMGFPTLIFATIMAKAGGLIPDNGVFLGITLGIYLVFQSLMTLAALIDGIVCHRAINTVKKRGQPLTPADELWADIDEEEQFREAWIAFKVQKKTA